MTENTAWRLFLDDDADDARRPDISVENPGWRMRAGLSKNPPFLQHLGDWVIAKNYQEAIEAINALGFPSFVSFDHDIASKETGVDVAKYLIDIDLDTGAMPEDFGFEVHSANPVGRRNIIMLLENYLGQKEWPSNSRK